MLSALLLCGEDATVRTVTRVFKDLGVDVDACVDQKNAIRKMTAKKFDAIIADDEIHGATHTLEAALDFPLCQISKNHTGGKSDSVGLAFERGTQIVLYKPLSPERVRHGLRAVRNLMAQERRGGFKRVRVELQATLSYGKFSGKPITVEDLAIRERPSDRRIHCPPRRDWGSSAHLPILGSRSKRRLKLFGRTLAEELGLGSLTCPHSRANG